jgi:uncharacterized protein YjiK
MKRFLYRLCFIFLILSLIFCISSCRPGQIKLASPAHYNFSQVVSDKLDIKLLEISGIAWDSKNNVFLAISDESGKLYSLDKGMHLMPDEPVFGDAGDYEDVALYNGVPYILRSDGQIIRVVKESSGKTYGLVAGKIGLSGTNDFETLYFDPGRKALVVLCKNCKSDDEKTVSAFAFYPDSTGFDNKPLFRIDAGEVRKLSPFNTSKLQPSAAAINPVTHELYILSSASRQLVIADSNGRPESVYKLSKSLFPQPEGIAFNKNGDMFISNEGLGGKPSVLTFRFIADTGFSKTQTSKAGYNFSLPDEKMELGKHLHEISGMAYIPGKDLILGENDEKGDIFTFDFKNKNDNVGKIKFGGKGDYEDIVYTDSAIYMLVSSGSIIQVETKDSSFSTKEFTLEGGKNEFETLYLDAEKKSLIMLCKECAHEKKNEVRVAYRFDLTTNSFDPLPLYTIDIEDIKKILGDEEVLFKPSAAGINPVNGKLYIVASVGKLLVIADKNTGKPEQVYKLDPALYNQPEGMTFAPNGDLYISNEGGEGIATVLKFNYRKN